MMMMEESPKQHKFAFRRAYDVGLLGCFMGPRPKRQAPSSPSTSSTSSKKNFFCSDDPDLLEQNFLATFNSALTENDSPRNLPARSLSGSHLLPDAATAPLLDPDTEATEESFVFTPIAPSSHPLESLSFRTLSDPLLSTFSYNCGSVETQTLTSSSKLTPSASSNGKYGGRPHPLPAPASPYRAFEGSVKPVWLPLPEPESKRSSFEARSTASGERALEQRSIVSERPGAAGSWSIRRGKLTPVGGLPLPPPEVATKLLPGLESYEFGALVRGTRDFAAECCMEKGEFGAIYRAWMQSDVPEGSSGKELAVVRLTVDQNQALKNWRTEVQMLSQLPDSNLCAIKGYCAHEGDTGEPSERLLVFEQSPNGNLHDYLSGSRSKTQLDWSARISIVLGAARGLLYLHDRAPFQIVYREFQSSSVLLDKDYTPRLAGYGLAVTSSPSDKRSSLLSVMKRSQAHARSNVWSFGVVLVELLTGKYNRDSTFQYDEKSFLQWAKPFLKEESKLVLILDPRMKGKCSMKGASKLAELALRCLKKKEAHRPSMARVVDTLKSIKENFGGRVEVNSKLLLQPSVPSFGGASFRDFDQRPKAVDRKLLSVGSGSSISVSSEDDDTRTSLQSGRILRAPGPTLGEFFEYEYLERFRCGGFCI